MSHAHRTTGLGDDAIAFILFRLIGLSLLRAIVSAFASLLPL